MKDTNKFIDPFGLEIDDPFKIFFSQDTIGANFGDNSSPNVLIEQLKNNPNYYKQVEPIRLVKLADLPPKVQDRLLKQGAGANDVFTVDNRRLHAAREANSKVNSIWATKENLGNINLNRRFSTKTAGRTIEIRCP